MISDVVQIVKNLVFNAFGKGLQNRMGASSSLEELKLLTGDLGLFGPQFLYEKVTPIFPP